MSKHIITGSRTSIGSPYVVYVPLYGWVSAMSDEADGFAFESAEQAQAYLTDAQSSARRLHIGRVAVSEVQS